ncbi:MAG TPA: potassium transporter KtrB, partial [Rikenellaceae bacterium]|nr:potassium transporter KtrB [Rikenellaceae bacterium]
MRKEVKSVKQKILRFLRYDFETILTFGFSSKHPYRQLSLGYFSYIIFGTLLLCLPFMTLTDVNVMDNMFTAASAISTTGLSTVDVAKSYGLLGQVVILILIQLGGIGYMTMSSFIMLRLTKHFTMIKKHILEAEFSIPGNININNLVQSVVYFTFIFEFFGAILLYIFFLQSGADSPVWSAIFHSVSSFCTAGFSIYSDNLMQFSTNIGVNSVVMVLSYAGAMGFIVMTDLWNKITIRKYQISFSTKIIVLITLILSVWGTSQMYFFEPAFTAYSPFDRFLVSLFHTMSALTTVGYNTVNVGNLVPLTLMTITLIMYFGASPSGTGGGLKSTTTSAVFAFVKSKLSLERDVYLFNNRIPTYRVDNALTTFILYSFVLITGTYFLTATEPDKNFIQLLFEAAPALGTVGLSTGITFDLSSAGKIILIVLMYLGRVGVLTI